MSAPFVGPWKRNGHRQIADAIGDVVCEVFSGPCGIEEADRRERVIAAAPELLSLLVDAVESFGPHLEGGDDEWLTFARAAIAKAMQP